MVRPCQMPLVQYVQCRVWVTKACARLGAQLEASAVVCTHALN